MARTCFYFGFGVAVSIRVQTSKFEARRACDGFGQVLPSLNAKTHRGTSGHLISATGLAITLQAFMFRPLVHTIKVPLMHSRICKSVPGLRTSLLFCLVRVCVCVCLRVLWLHGHRKRRRPEARIRELAIEPLLGGQSCQGQSLGLGSQTKVLSWCRLRLSRVQAAGHVRILPCS